MVVVGIAQIEVTICSIAIEWQMAEDLLCFVCLVAVALFADFFAVRGLFTEREQAHLQASLDDNVMLFMNLSSPNNLCPYLSPLTTCNGDFSSGRLHKRAFIC